MTDGAVRDQPPIDPKRVRAFATFFKGYMSVSSLVVASLPVPVTSLGLIPTFSAQTKLLSVYASLFCFLILGFIFYSRHQLARLMFPEHFPQDKLAVAFEAAFQEDPSTEEPKAKMRTSARRSIRERMWRRFIVVLPLLFIAASLVSIFQYNDVLVLNVREIAQRPAFAAQRPEFKSILEKTDLNEIQYSSRLMILYLAIFLTAEAAFVMMAIKEYLQDIIGLSEMELMRGYRDPKAPEQPAN